MGRSSIGINGSVRSTGDRGDGLISANVGRLASQQVAAEFVVDTDTSGHIAIVVFWAS